MIKIDGPGVGSPMLNAIHRLAIHRLAPLAGPVRKGEAETIADI